MTKRCPVVVITFDLVQTNRSISRVDRRPRPTYPATFLGYQTLVDGWYRLAAVLLCFQELEVTDDTVLERHTEDPATVQIRLLGQGGTYPALTSAQSRFFRSLQV